MKSIFSTRLKEERIKNNYTQQQLADLINEEREDFNRSETKTKISRVSITRYENGSRTPDYDTLCTIAYILNTDIDYLLGKSDKKHQEAINGELINFINYINEIANKDDSNINDLLWPIINTFSNSIKQGIEHNLLKKIENIYSFIDGHINRSVNTNDPEILDKLQILLNLYHRHDFNKTNLNLQIKLLRELKENEKDITKSIESSKSPEDTAIYEKLLNKIKKDQKKAQRNIFKIKEEQEAFEKIMSLYN
ncbi:hypothetical protein CJF15_18200 [Clostridium botulinum]|uniref:helix-turn-helix domain-containing protein n=1 Tax=Clostridium botulinum TaxID=1491 RepID=UPI0013F0A03B|nr:helix-turn-helix transcriptional regulator [Clostridium botulinum]MBN3410987.1 hypothetical protein [Clostridium botulinum]MBY6875076.1 helix-turn-helix transcriptional regulator [Clostridium botulinum]NEZ80487.1 XRE family transcriptional regulator [Clostridium botulinum]NFA17844.1 XRE family transcriptional regulator [Clostridium botulinum]NFA54440.1 XRE family transcriptional regulator [Clostridium botulinum]